MNPTPLLLSIVIPSRYRTDLLKDCLQSLHEHRPAGCELIVVDDGSEDAGVSSTAKSFPNVRCLRLPKPFGFCVAANRGIGLAQGEFVQILNDDTLVTEGWSEAALARFADKTVGAVAPLVLRGTPNTTAPIRIDSAGDLYDLGGFAQKRGHLQPLSPDYLVPDFVFGASGSSAFYRRSALNRIGLFPEEFGAYFEDVDLSWRLNRAGFRVAYEPSCRVWHRCGASYGKANRQLVERQSLNEERVFWRNLPGNRLRRAIPRHFAVLVAKAVRRLREGTLVPFLLGRARALAEFRTLLRYRASLALRDAAPESE